MAKEKTYTLFVIFDGPQPREGPRTRYISKDGNSTTYRHESATFYTFDDAKNFAERHQITLNEHTYIGQEDFTGFDLRG